MVDLDEIESLKSVMVTGGRGPVTLDGNTVYINDDGYGGSSVYKLQLCGPPSPDAGSRVPVKSNSIGGCRSNRGGTVCIIG